MVVALDDLPPLLWHAELARSLEDVWTGERQRGVHLHPAPRTLRARDRGGLASGEVASFDERAQRFWRHDSDYLVEAPLTEEGLSAAEDELRVKLPAAYVTLLRVQNGGVVCDELTAFPTTESTTWSKDWVPFPDMMGIGTGTQTILRSPYLTGEWEMPPELVLLTGDGDWWIALDYRDGGASGEPSVVYYDTDVDMGYQLAPDFETFIEGLLPEANFVEPAPAFDPEALPPRSYATVGSPIERKIEKLRGDLAMYQAGDRSLDATRAWLAAHPSEVLVRLPRRATKDLRKAVKRLRRADPADLEEAVEAIVRELERLLPGWVTLEGITGSFYDERYLREKGLGTEADSSQATE